MDRKFPVYNTPEKFENTTGALATKAVDIQLYLMALGRSCLATMFLVESCSVLASWFPCEHSKSHIKIHFQGLEAIFSHN